MSDTTARDFKELVKPGYIHSRAYTDQAVFDREMDAIFGRSWVYLAHDSEIAEPGDYLTTRIGLTPVIVSRGDDGTVHALLNRCIHRAATVCQSASGNSKHFRCQYHGWTYRNSGELVGVTFPKGYGSEFDELKAGGLSAVEVGEYRGFIFGRLLPGGRTLQDHLGIATKYLDAFVDSAPESQVKVHAPPSRYRYGGNWKFSVENLYDGYHPGFVHSGFLKAAMRRNGSTSNPFGKEEVKVPTVDLGDGHAGVLLSDVRLKSKRAEGDDYGDSYFDRAMNAPGGRQLYAKLSAEIGEEAALASLEPGSADNIGIFPNLLLVQTQIRVVFPVAPNETEVVAHATEWPAAPPVVNQLRLRVQEGFWGPAGMGVPDDLEMFERVQRGLIAETPEWLNIRRGLEREETDDLGVVRGYSTDETALRGFQAEWFRCLTEGP